MASTSALTTALGLDNSLPPSLGSDDSLTVSLDWGNGVWTLSQAWTALIFTIAKAIKILLCIKPPQSKKNRQMPLVSATKNGQAASKLASQVLTYRVV
ncbi:hypothetical protein [Acaryochloris thomasi]|uniref:hypothetical protein n=1 Tax=Acaryochloris thomasi TaxID=2929456 RepID=UPI0013148B08|nr:hypothetical protein [Acaryochloris thomasi]